ncbi:MAG: hypothetical protein AAF074_02180 [Pseudomonadota bacterium]
MRRDRRRSGAAALVAAAEARVGAAEMDLLAAEAARGRIRSALNRLAQRERKEAAAEVPAPDPGALAAMGRWRSIAAAQAAEAQAQLVAAEQTCHAARAGLAEARARLEAAEAVGRSEHARALARRAASAQEELEARAVRRVRGV